MNFGLSTLRKVCETCEKKSEVEYLMNKRATLAEKMQCLYQILFSRGLTTGIHFLSTVVVL